MPELPATTVITEVIEKYADDLVALRRDLHAHPELGWGEARTSECVVSALDGRRLVGEPARRRRRDRRHRHG